MSERFERGIAELTRLNGADGVAVIDRLSEFAPDFGEQLVEFIFGDVYTRPELNLKTRQIVTISALAAMGHALPQLEIHLRGGLNAGLTPEELREIIHHVAPYAGFPAALNAMAVVRRVCGEAAAETTTMPQ